MANKSKRNKKPIPKAAAPKAVEQASPKKMDYKKVLVVAAAIVVVIIISIFIDNAVRNPRVTDHNDASNRVFAADVLANNPEIEFETPVMVDTQQALEEIDGKSYYKVIVTLYYETPQAKDFFYYVAQKDGKIYTMDEGGALVPYGV